MRKKNLKKSRYMTELLCCTQKLTTLCINYSLKNVNDHI